jgi:hypothetical protein
MKTFRKLAIKLCLSLALFALLSVAGASLSEPPSPITDPIPNFDFTEPSPGYYSTVTFFDLSQGEETIVYQYGDGVTEGICQGEVFTHVYQPGLYTVTATAYSNMGTSHSISKTVYVPLPSGNFSVFSE